MTEQFHNEGHATNLVIARFFAGLAIATVERPRSLFFAALRPAPCFARGTCFATPSARGLGRRAVLAALGVAVDEAAGLAYVSDTGNGRVEVFKRGAGGPYDTSRSSRCATQDRSPSIIRPANHTIAW